MEAAISRIWRLLLNPQSCRGTKCWLLWGCAEEPTVCALRLTAQVNGAAGCVCMVIWWRPTPTSLPGPAWEEGRGSVSNLLVCDEDLEGRNEVSHGDGGVVLPLLHGLDIVDEDNEVLAIGALVVALGLCSFALNHFDGCWMWWFLEGAIGDDGSR